MKKIINAFFKVCIITCYMLTTSIFCALFINLSAGQNQFSNKSILQLILISFVGAIIQWLAFSEDVIKRLKYSYRIFVFMIPFYLMLSSCAYIWHWFDTTKLYYWIAFFGLLIIAFILSYAISSVYYKVTGQKYNEKLEEYKANK